MWKGNSCSLLSGVIKEGLGHTEKAPGGPMEHLREQQDSAAGFLRLVTVRDFKWISLIVEASLRPSVCVGGRV